MAFMLDCVAVGCRLFLTRRPRYPYTVTSRGSALVFQCNVEPDRVDCQSDNVYEISLNDKWFVQSVLFQLISVQRYAALCGLRGVMRPGSIFDFGTVYVCSFIRMLPHLYPFFFTFSLLMGT